MYHETTDNICTIPKNQGGSKTGVNQYAINKDYVGSTTGGNQYAISKNFCSKNVRSKKSSKDKIF